MRTANPALSTEVFTGIPSVGNRSETMTISGVINKTAILLLLLLLAAGYTWSLYFKAGSPAAVGPWTTIGAVAGFVIAIVTVFKKEWAPFTAPAYAICEGLFIGGISSVLDASYPGVVIQASALTFGTLAAMLFLYKTGIIKVTDQLRLGIVAATGGIVIFYLVAIGLSFFGIQAPLINGSSLWSIGFSVFVVAIAALNLVLDFDFIDRGTASRALAAWCR